MAFTLVEKMKITKYLKEHAVDDIYYIDLVTILCRKEKVQDIEFIRYFTDTVAKEFRKDDKISIKQLTKMVLMIERFLNWMHDEKSEIDEDTLNIIRSLEELYDDYLNRTGFDIDLEFTDDVIGKVLDTANKLYPSKSDGGELVGKYINQIAYLEEKIKKLSRDLEESARLYGILEEAHKKASERLAISEQQVIVLGRENKDKTADLEELSNTIKELNDRIAELESLLGDANNRISELAFLETKYKEVSDEVAKLQKIIEDDIQKQADLVAKRSQDAQIEAIMYQQLLFGSANIESLLNALKRNGFVSTKKDVYELLQKMKSKINITTSSFSISPKYQIVAPTVLENGEFVIDIPHNCKHYDVMLVSDFHLKNVDSRAIAGFDVLNDYCVTNGINLILNLGDLFHGTAGHIFDYGCAVSNYRMVEKSISMIPKAEGIYHAVLGGNHDRNTLKYGFDPIAMLCDGREDFIHLGYNHATIALKGFSSMLGKFDIHHPETFDFPIDLTDNAVNFEDMSRYLDDIYSALGCTRNDSYIDIFGHTHKSQFNYPNGYCFIPPYFEGKSKRGACHLRIYFDEDTDIKYMVFMPLAYSDKLIKTNELIYQKTLNSHNI